MILASRSEVFVGALLGHPGVDEGVALQVQKLAPVSLGHAELSGPGWTGLRDLVETAPRLTDAMSDDPLAHAARGYHRFRRYAPRMLQALEIEAAPVCTPLMAAVSLIRDHRDSRDQPFGFVRRNSKWRRLLTARRDDGRLWEVAVLFHLRDAFRSGDIWLRHSRRYADWKRALVPAEIVVTTATLAVPLAPEDWLADRMTRVHAGLRRLANAARMGLLPGASVEEGILRTDRIPVDPPAAADELILDLYRRLPEVRITDILLEVDQATGFTDAFSYARVQLPTHPHTTPTFPLPYPLLETAPDAISVRETGKIGNNRYRRMPLRSPELDRRRQGAE